MCVSGTGSSDYPPVWIMPLSSITCKSGFKYPVFTVGDRNHFIQPWRSDVRQRLFEVRNLPVRSDDIFAGGPQKCGTNWTYELVSMIVRQETTFAEAMPYRQAPEMVKTDNLLELAESWKSPRIIFYHLRLTSELPAQIVEQRPKIVVTIRNPKDRLVSLYHMVKNLDGESHFAGSWDDFLSVNMDGCFPEGLYLDYLLDLEHFQREHPEVPVYVLIYEKMKENLLKEVQGLCQFLEKPSDIAEDIARIGQFEVFKPAIEQFKFDAALSKLFRKDAGKFIRKGIVGEWKSWFTVAQRLTTLCLKNEWQDRN